jgi:hypothetical protein
MVTDVSKNQFVLILRAEQFKYSDKGEGSTTLGSVGNCAPLDKSYYPVRLHSSSTLLWQQPVSNIFMKIFVLQKLLFFSSM